MSNIRHHNFEVTGKRLSKEDRRGQLISISVDLFNSYRYEEISITDVAKAAGISHGLIYHYFSSKESCFLAAVKESSKHFIDQVIPPEEMSNPEKVEYGIKRYVDFMEAYSITYLNLFRSSAASLPEIRSICEQTRETIIKLFLESIVEIENLKIDLNELDLTSTRLALKGFLGWAETIVLDWLENRQVDREVVERMLLIGAASAVYVGLENDVGGDIEDILSAQLTNYIHFLG